MNFVMHLVEMCMWVGLGEEKPWNRHGLHLSVALFSL